ncbi:hypothetical protein SCHIN_v1c03440 [Spiroplasma chinense]|uniref:Lipoprotein n=1 Tax=Spiroplasma chinense TaxID=216932 RepID=A0A5B9Y3G2_9MOLU|nr:lipoprotein [Spiroplasma chinense]QEH61541.1 hypothetical protein SCHIN_v1c03440 [Spiroplasma chinense]
MKKILSILGSTLLVVPGTTSTISCGPPKKDSNKLEDIIKVTDLGEFDSFLDITISKSTLYDRFVELNNKIEPGDVLLYLFDDSSAYIVPDIFSNKTGRVKITFTVKQENSLKSFITQTDLGTIENKKSETIINKLKELNPQIDELEYPSIRVDNTFDLFEDSQTISNRGFEQPGVVSVTFKVG